jgi:hypothetical protein
LITQATLEIEFMHQTLSRYVTSNTAKMLSDLYTKISQAYARRPGDETLQSNLDGVKRTLSDTVEKKEKRTRSTRSNSNAREQRPS